MAGPNRLPPPFGARLDRDRGLAFTFEGKSYDAIAGDTIASALAANGQWILSRSFKYHRPRGILTMAGQDANTLVQIGGEPNALADRVAVADGMAVSGQNYFGSLDRDRATLLGKVGRFLPVGFYYKTFYKPRGAFKYWERVIRAMAGLGKVDLDAHHGYYDKKYGFCDVAVIGGGPAGMAAALEAASHGAEVMLIEENPSLGGALNYARFDAEGVRAFEIRRDLAAQVAEQPNITVLTDAVCQAWFADNWLPVTQGNRMHKIRARAVVAATGSMEQQLVFRNNDLPGIMMGSAAQRLIREFAVRPGRRAVVATANGDGYAVALDLNEAGVEVAAVVDLRETPAPTAMSAAVAAAGIGVLPGRTLTEAIAANGNRHVTGVRVARITGEGSYADDGETIDCDLVCMSTGYTPNAALLYHAGAAMAYDDATHMFAIRSLPPHAFAAGSLNGVFAEAAVVADGRRAGWAAAADCGLATGDEPAVPTDKGAEGQSAAWPMFAHPKHKEFVDYDEDLQIADILNAAADGYEDIQLLKRYSTVGMGPSQGRHSSVPSVRLAAKATGRAVNDVGTTTTRPPVGPKKMAHLAGRTFEPVRYTAMHHRHLEAGAEMMVAGIWMRPAYYGVPARREAAIREEVVNVRENVGLIDVSTLGGLEIRGPDAAEFMNRIYTFAYLKQPVARARYVLMTDDSGVIVDDGVACRFHDHHFYVTATTGGVDNVYRNMLWHNAQWRLDVDVTHTTAAYAGVNIAGPKARDVLARVCDDIDLSAEAFPYMGVRTGNVAGIPSRLLRVGFVGELGYEVHCPADHGEALWDALMEAGRADGIRPFGIEAQRVLRLEKGHIIVTQDTDGLTHPYEADMAWAIARKKPYYVGMRSVDIQNRAGLTRKLVGFTMDDTAEGMPLECHLVVRGDDIVGRVTSCALSPTLNKVIGLAYVAPDQGEPGTRFDIKIDGGKIVQGEVVALPFYDPDNQRQEL
jgi:sarcosine oxidase subunit alpha